MNNKTLIILGILVFGSGAFCFVTGASVFYSMCEFGFDCDTNNSYVGIIMLVWSGVAVLFVIPSLIYIETTTVQQNQ